MDREDSDQTGQTSRLIRVFAGRTTTLLVLSCRGSLILKGRKLHVLAKVVNKIPALKLLKWDTCVLVTKHSYLDHGYLGGSGSMP